MDRPATPPRCGARGRGRRTAILGFIGVYVALQLLLPLHYYLVRNDENDERFAWRMFSSDRVTRCGSGPGLRHPPRFEVDGEAVDLYGEFHEAWITIARRGRLRVVEAMALELCDRNPGGEVRLHLSCAPLGAQPYEVSAGERDLCAEGDP